MTEEQSVSESATVTLNKALTVPGEELPEMSVDIAYENLCKLVRGQTVNGEVHLLLIQSLRVVRDALSAQR